jgi:hypothetical protein
MSLIFVNESFNQNKLDYEIKSVSTKDIFIRYSLISAWPVSHLYSATPPPFLRQA